MTDITNDCEIRNKGLRLVKVGIENFDDLIDLEVDPCQREFVADNIYSLAEAYACLAAGRFVQPFGIYDGETPVGFAMIGHNCEIDGDRPEYFRHSYDLWRFMIDRRWQGRGYGRDAMRLLLDYISNFPDGEEDLCFLSYAPSNLVAKRLYASFGFVPNGDMDGDEEIAVLRLKESSAGSDHPAVPVRP